MCVRACYGLLSHSVTGYVVLLPHSRRARSKASPSTLLAHYKSNQKRLYSIRLKQMISENICRSSWCACSAESGPCLRCDLCQLRSHEHPNGSYTHTILNINGLHVSYDGAKHGIPFYLSHSEIFSSEWVTHTRTHTSDRIRMQFFVWPKHQRH